MSTLLKSEAQTFMDDQRQKWQKIKVYLWTYQDVVSFLNAQGGDLVQYAGIAEANAITGSQLLGADETHLKALLTCSARHAHEIYQQLKAIRLAEIAAYPRISAPVLAKIDVCKRTSTMTLNEMKLSRFPDIVCDMIHIVNLSFIGNQIRTLPPEIGLMTRLTSLKGGRNRLVAIPESFGCLKNLQLVLLEENELSTLPESLSSCGSLKILDISQNRIEMLPLSLYRCSSLSKLNLYDNPLAIPKEVAERGAKAVLQALEALQRANESCSLNLNDFHIRSIPKLILISSLTNLSLDGNLLKRVNGLHVLFNLTNLSFCGNQVERIPLDFCMLSKLQTIKTDQNPIISPPQCVVDLGTKAVLRYLKAHRCILQERTRDLFDAFDEDGSGFISKNEFVAGLYKVDLKLSQTEIFGFLGEYDKDGSGSISFDELEDFLASNSLSEMRDGTIFINALDLSNIGLRLYSIVLQGAGKITSLLLHDNELRTLPDNLFMFDALCTLDLDNNKICEFPSPVGILTSLKRLSIRGNQIRSIPAWLFVSPIVTGLEEFFLENNALTSIPCDMVRFRALNQLGLKGNPLANPLKKILDVGSEFAMGYLKLFYDSKLTGVLDLCGMNLERVPDEADFRPILTCLLRQNSLKDLPFSMSLANEMLLLDFSDNCVEKIPDIHLHSFKTIRELVCSRNHLDSISRSIDELQHLQVLRLDNNVISSLPNNLSTLASLTLLDISHNKLPVIPGSICALPALLDLNISYNKITYLPQDLGLMSALCRLFVRGNEITKLPDVFSKMNLVTLDVCNNPLQEIPLSLGSLVTCMQELFIDRNLHLDDPSDIIICRGTKLFLSYMNRQFMAIPNQDLDLSSLAITELTVPLQVLDSLAGGLLKLDLSFNSLHELPRSVGMCASLTVLNLANNHLSSLPSSTKQMKTLTHLDISGVDSEYKDRNRFSGVPEMLTYTPSIRVLSLSGNKITSFYRNIDNVASGGFSDALSVAKRAKERLVSGHSAKTFKAMVQSHVLDKVAMKLQSQNRTKQVGAIFQLLMLEELLVAKNAIRVLPGSISCFENLKRLDMHSNRLTSLPPDLGLCSNLTDLNFSDNCLSGLPVEIGSLLLLKKLDISRNQISKLPNEVGFLASLEHFDIRNNRIEYLPVELEALSFRLQEMLVDGNDIKDPPLEILRQGRDVLFGYFRHIFNSKRSKDLILIDMRLERINMNFFELTALTALELSGNLISELPSGVLLLTNLTVLKAPGNNLMRLVETGNLASLAQLILLNVKDNCLSELEDSFSSLVHLKELNLRQNKLKTIIPGIRYCNELIRLNLGQNHLEILCKEVFRIPDLEFFDASHNSLSTLPSSICFAVNLKEVDISFNRLQSLPAEFGNLEQLRLLNLNQNMLRELPSSFKRCTSLKQLLLNNNKLSILPPEIRRFKDLEELHVRHNNLFSIPPDIRYLQNLKILACDGNHFLSAPSSLADMAGLKEVCVNEIQTAALITGGSDITPVLSIMDSSELAVEQRKVPKTHMRDGLESMAGYLSRLHLPCSAPAVDLTHMRLNTLPAELLALTQLTLLDLKDNVIEELPESIICLSKLKHLDLSSNHLLSVGNSLGFLTDLTWLSVAKNQITSIPDSVRLLQSLRFLDLHVNALTTILAINNQDVANHSEFPVVDVTRKDVDPNAASQQIAMLDQDLKPIELQGGQLSGFAVVSSMRDLEVSYNKLRFLPDLRALRFLKRMNLSHNIIEELPEELCELPVLVKLEAGDNRLHRIPQSVSLLTSLSVLSLKNNSLDSIPVQLCRCVALKYLSLNANNISTIPDEISDLTALSRLTIAANNISSLPNSLDKMISLSHLEISHNPLKTLPPSLGSLYDTLKVLLIMDCSNLQDPPPNVLLAGQEHVMNYLRKVWRGFCTMRLVITGLSLGTLVCLHHFQYKNLVEIRIDKNEIKIIPDIICIFTNLVSLRFRDNLVSSLPSEFSKLINLQELDMSKNKFRTMPQVILKMTHVIRLRCGENPIAFTIPSGWIEDKVGKFLSDYVRETTGKRIASMFMNNNLKEVFEAWQDLLHATDNSGAAKSSSNITKQQ